MSAVISACTLYRYRLDRKIADEGKVFGFFGVNGSTADAEYDDHTVRKWIGFTRVWRGSRFIVGNRFGYRSKKVSALGAIADPFGAENDFYLEQIISEADILVPCWGSRGKLPKHLRSSLDALTDKLFASCKPVQIFGLTKSGDPLHPLMLSYSTPLKSWKRG